MNKEEIETRKKLIIQKLGMRHYEVLEQKALKIIALFEEQFINVNVCVNTEADIETEASLEYNKQEIINELIIVMEA